MDKKIKCNYCDKYFTSRHSKCNHIKLKHYEKHCEENMRNENNNTYKSYLKLINILAYNNKDLILNTWIKQKQQQLENIVEPDEIIWDDNVNINDIKLL